MTVEELADWLGYEVAEIIGVLAPNQTVQVTMAEVVSNVITSNVVAWAISKINPPPEIEIALGLIDGDDLVPVYKLQYDPNREDYLGGLEWWGAKIGNGTIRLEGNPAAEEKVKVYKSPAKGKRALEWGEVVVPNEPNIWVTKPIDAQGPEAIGNFYVEGIDPSASLNDVKITLRYVPEKASISGLVSAELSPSADLTVYDVSFEEDQAFEGFDDNSEGELQIPALMVPLGANDQPGTNTVKVAVQPAGLHNLFELAAVNPPEGNGDVSVDAPGPLASSSSTITVTGRVHNIGSQLEVQRISDDLLVARLWTDVKKRLAGPDVHLFRVADEDETVEISTGIFVPDFPDGLTIAQAQDRLDITWGKQANVHFDVVDSDTESIEYDVNNDGLDTGSQSITSEMETIASETFGDWLGGLPVFFVNKFTHGQSGGEVLWDNKSVIFINQEKSPLRSISHEVGHGLGLLNSDHSLIPSDVMVGNSLLEVDNKRVRRVDWNKVNP